MLGEQSEGYKTATRRFFLEIFLVCGGSNPGRQSVGLSVCQHRVRAELPDSDFGVLRYEQQHRTARLPFLRRTALGRVLHKPTISCRLTLTASWRC